MVKKLKFLIPLILLIVLLIFVGDTMFFEFNESGENNSNTCQILINSAKRAKYDLEDLDTKVKVADTNMTYGELNTQLEDLKKNLETIEEIDPVTLSKTDLINYKVYHHDLKMVVKLSEVAANDLRKKQSTTVSDKDELDSDIADRRQYHVTISRLVQVLEQDENGLKQHRSLFDINYAKENPSN